MPKGRNHLWRKIAFWSITAALPLSFLIMAIAATSYWTIPAYPLRFEGDPLFAYDPEIGFVSRPNGRVILGRTFGGQFRVYTDRRGARVSAPSEQTPDRVDILFIGDSYTWGDGADYEDTFAFKTPKKLGRTGANLALAAYGTTQSLQVLRRNLNRKPKLVVYTLISDHLRRNVSSCAPSFYPFCLDTAYVAFESASHAKIHLPQTNGVRRVQLQLRHDLARLDPITWIVHGIDVAIGRALLFRANNNAADPVAQRSALEYLLGEMAAAVEGAGAKLLIVFVPMSSERPSPELVEWTKKHGIKFLDISVSLKERASVEEFYLPDRHPSPAGHEQIATEIAALIRSTALLPDNQP